MHPELAKEIVRICRSRSAEGDCPVTLPESVERLEQCVIELANQLEVLSADEPAIEAYKLFRKERQRRENAEAKLAEQAAKEPAEEKCDLPFHDETMAGLDSLTIRR